MPVVVAKDHMLKITTVLADKARMLSPTLQFHVTPQQQQLLHAYHAQAASLKVTDQEFNGWLERIDQLNGVEVDELTTLHGQLIASGLLKFEISGRSVGLKYQLSQQGKKALEVSTSTDDDQHSEAQDTDFVDSDSEVALDESLEDPQANDTEPEVDSIAEQPQNHTIETGVSVEAAAAVEVSSIVATDVEDDRPIADAA